MKTLYSVLAIVYALAIIGMVISISSHQVYAHRDCADFIESKNSDNEDL